MFWDNVLTSIKTKWNPAKSTVIGIDIGTTKIAAVIAKLDSKSPEILGVASIPFNGVTWSDINKTAITSEAINSVVNEACKEAGCPIPSAVVGISDITTGKNYTGVIHIKKRPASQRDVQRAVNAASEMIIPEDLVMLDQVVNSFTLDGIEGIDDPLGNPCSTLEALTHNVTCRRTVHEVVTAACKIARLNIIKMGVSEIASASILLSCEEKKQGICLLDIGGEYTSIVVYVNGALHYSASVPWGGNYLTSCIGLMLGLERVEAEKAKISFSKNAALTCNISQLKAISCLLDERVNELCNLLNCEMNKNGLKEHLGAGIIVSGGTSSLPDLPDIFERGFALPVRRADYQREYWLKNVPLEYASAVGLVLHGTK